MELMNSNFHCLFFFLQNTLLYIFHSTLIYVSLLMYYVLVLVRLVVTRWIKLPSKFTMIKYLFEYFDSSNFSTSKTITELKWWCYNKFLTCMCLSWVFTLSINQKKKKEIYLSYVQFRRNEHINFSSSNSLTNLLQLIMILLVKWSGQVVCCWTITSHKNLMLSKDVQLLNWVLVLVWLVYCAADFVERFF